MASGSAAATEQAETGSAAAETGSVTAEPGAVTAAPAPAAGAPAAWDLLAEDLVVEEISIDGMCGVY